MYVEAMEVEKERTERQLGKLQLVVSKELVRRHCIIVELTDILRMNPFMLLISLPTNSFMKHMYSSFTPNLRESSERHGKRGREGKESKREEGGGGKMRKEVGAVRKGSQLATLFCHGVQPHLVKLARFWITLATSVSFLDVFSSGYSEHRKKQSKIYKVLRKTEKGCGFEVCV